MKKYKFGLRFQKYDHTEIVKVTSLEEIRPIANGIAYDLMIKNDVEPKQYNRMKCEIYGLGESEQLLDYMLIYVNPVPFFMYQNLVTLEFLKDKRAKRKSFFECLFKYHKIAKFKKLKHSDLSLLSVTREIRVL